MIDYSKKESIRVLEANGYKFLGFNDIGWGEKFYVFETPNTETHTGVAYVHYKLGEMRRRAYLLDMQDWHRMQQASEAAV